MPENWATRLEAWTGDLSSMQNGFAVTAAGLLVMLLVYWFQRRRERALRADLDWLQTEGRRQTDELARRAERIAELEPQLRAEAQPARDQAPKQFGRAHLERALGDQVGIARHRHVVVVVVESPRREAGRAREGVQFVERSVRNEVAELRAVGRPAGRIDQHRHISRR